MQDLWADYAGEALATEGTGRGGGLRRFRLTDQAALMTLRAWLLRDYMLPYGTSLGGTRIFQRCYWVDGLGSVRVGSTGLPVPLPTPVVSDAEEKRGRRKTAGVDVTLPLALQLAHETARQLAQIQRPVTLSTFALDERRGKRKMSTGERASRAQAHAHAPESGLTIPKTGGILAGNWQELASPLLAALEQSAAVFLLDPLKDGLFRYADLAPLYQRTVPTELFLWFSHKQIETRLLPSLRTTAGAAALTNLLRGDRWKSLLTQESASAYPTKIIHGIVELLAESMRSHFLSVQQLNLPIRSGPALVEPAPYSLLFATRRQDSLFSLNDAVCKRARQLLIESQQGILHEEWFRLQRAEQAAASRSALAQETLVLGRAQRLRRWNDLRQQLLLNHFGLHTLAEYDQIILELLARGDVRCERRKPVQDVTGQPLPGNDDILLWT